MSWSLFLCSSKILGGALSDKLTNVNVILKCSWNLSVKKDFQLVSLNYFPANSAGQLSSSLYYISSVLWMLKDADYINFFWVLRSLHSRPWQNNCDVTRFFIIPVCTFFKASDEIFGQSTRIIFKYVWCIALLTQAINHNANTQRTYKINFMTYKGEGIVTNLVYTSCRHCRVNKGR